MPYLRTPADVIFLAGWCLGPNQYGTANLLLYKRVWQAYQTPDGVLHLRRSNAARTDWDFDDVPDGLEGVRIHNADLAFDKAGQPVIAFERDDGAIWVRRVSIVEGKRAVLLERIAPSGVRPRVVRDYDQDILVFYGDNTDPANTVIKWRVQAEGWQQEHVVPIEVQGVKYLQGVAVTRSWSYLIVFAMKDVPNAPLYCIETPQYPILLTEAPALAARARASTLGMYDVVYLSGDDRIGAQGAASTLELFSLDINLTTSDIVQASALVTTLAIYTTLTMSVADTTPLGASGTASTLILYDMVYHTVMDWNQMIGVQAAVTTLEITAA